MAIDIGPELEWGAKLSDGSIIGGSRESVLESVLQAWSAGGAYVVEWKTPGATPGKRKSKAERLNDEYVSLRRPTWRERGTNDAIL